MMLKDLSVEEINLILSGLGKLPFERVFQLVSKIQVQSQVQLAPAAASQANGQPEPHPEAPPPAG